MFESYQIFLDAIDLHYRRRIQIFSFPKEHVRNLNSKKLKT